RLMECGGCPIDPAQRRVASSAAQRRIARRRPQRRLERRRNQCHAVWPCSKRRVARSGDHRHVTRDDGQSWITVAGPRLRLLLDGRLTTDWRKLKGWVAASWLRFVRWRCRRRIGDDGRKWRQRPAILVDG